MDCRDICDALVTFGLFNHIDAISDIRRIRMPDHISILVQDISLPAFTDMQAAYNLC